MEGRSTCLTCLAIALLWVAVMAILCVLTWPHVPLDISTNDPATLAAFRVATWKHLGFYIAAAFGLPIVIMSLSKVWQHLRR
jgi:hypothetical protein